MIIIMHCLNRYSARDERTGQHEGCDRVFCKTRAGIALNTNKRETTLIIHNFCIALFSGLHKLTALYNIVRHLQR